MKRCAVIGHPIAHSLSPALHTAAYAHEGRDAVYEAIDIEPASLGTELRRLAAEGYVGVNVTLPHKESALALADDRSSEAEATGAANVLVFADRMVAHNTDVVGIQRALTDLGIDVAGKRAVIVGAGGSARAAVVALQRSDADIVAMINRTEAKARTVVADIAPGVKTGPLSSLAGIEAEVLIHTTSVGLGSDDALFEADALGAFEAVLDLVYGPEETELVRRARQAGSVAADGLGVLVHQAAAAYELFWDATAPLETMRHAALDAAGRS